MFDCIASSGRTATTYIASALNGLDDVVACHEGYAGGDKSRDPLLPLINLENARAYASPEAARDIVSNKRTDSALTHGFAGRLIDVAYYNATIGAEILRQNPASRMIGIIRDCEGFVRSCTTLTGEDPLPVGWPDPAKPLSAREKFIAMGRIRPRKGSPDSLVWPEWSAIRRNIWLWQETNLLICAARREMPARTRLVRFETFRRDPAQFWQVVLGFLDLPVPATPPQAALADAINTKPAGYQVGPAPGWTAEERAALATAQMHVKEAALYDC